MALGSRRALRVLLRPPTRLDTVEGVTEHLMHVFGVIGSPGFRSERPALRAQLEKVARRGYDRAGAERQLLAILASGDRRALLARITAPTLVIHGADDPLVPVAAGIDTARHIPGAQLKVVPGMGHDFAPALQPAIADWIAAHIRRAPILHEAGGAAAAGAPLPRRHHGLNRQAGDVTCPSGGLRGESPGRTCHGARAAAIGARPATARHRAPRTAVEAARPVRRPP